jgi:hypothetical protein
MPMHGEAPSRRAKPGGRSYVAPGMSSPWFPAVLAAPSGTTASCSWTSCRSSPGPRVRRSVNRSRRARSRSHGHDQRPLPGPLRAGRGGHPCPCGHLGDSRFACRCSPYDLHRYARRLSGPLLDRIDLYVQAERLTAEELTDAADAEPTAPVRARVLAARARQRTRQGAENGRLASADVAGHCQVVPAARRTLMSAVDRLGLSARGFHRALRVARTVADLADSDRVEDEHVREALTLRHLPIIGDRETQLI